MDLIIFGLIVLGLPVLGIVIDMIVMQKMLDPAMEKKRLDYKNWDEVRPQIKAKMTVLRTMPFVGLAFGLLMFILVATSDVVLQSEVEEKILLSVGLAVGVSSLFMCIGMAVFFREAIPGIVKEPEIFGKYLIITSLPMTGAVYGLTLSILLIMGVGYLEPVDVIVSPEDANYLFRAYMIFTGLTAFLILKGYLPTRVKGEMNSIVMDKSKSRGKGGSPPTPQPDPVFAKKMIYAVIPEVFLVIGFIIVLMSIMNKGVL